MPTAVPMLSLKNPKGRAWVLPEAWGLASNFFILSAWHAWASIKSIIAFKTEVEWIESFTIYLIINPNFT
jgi:hypothetical protein